MGRMGVGGRRRRGERVERVVGGVLFACCGESV